MNHMAGDHRPIGVLEAEVAPLREQLAAHPIYASVKSECDLRIFLESHVYAVWDFMSLLKSLQRSFTCVEVPWTPSRFAGARRFINEIVLAEESDEYQGRTMSHFEIYLEAMERVRANTRPIRTLLDVAAAAGDWKSSLRAAPAPAKAFVESTFRVIEHGSVAAQAAAFTFGREDVIPGMFRSVVKNLNRHVNGQLDQLIWYLERHIEVDGDDHGPLALKMVADVCGDSAELWAEATDAARTALRARIALWDGVLSEIEQAVLSSICR
jgi:pyrroloquinoline quinone (PQQ) biosynthesis protein C